MGVAYSNFVNATLVKLNLFRPWSRFAPVRRAVGFLPDPAKEFIKRAILNERQDYAR